MKWFFTFTLTVCLLFSIRTSAQISCNYTLEMFDSFGDGWNGSFLTITINGTPTDYTLDDINDDGEFASVSIVVTDGDEINLSYSPGGFENEVSYALYNPDGILVFGDGPFPITGELFSGTLICPSCPSPPPSTVSIDDVRAFYADISWVASDPDGTYLIEFDTAGFTTGTGNIREVLGEMARLETLQENTDYEFYISVACVNGDTSVVNGPYAFTTLWAIDVGVTEILTPISDCDLGVADTVEVTLANFGGNPQSLIPFNFSVNGVPGGVNQPIDGFFTGVLGKDSLFTLPFETTFDFSEPGEYIIQAWTELENDAVVTNDTTEIMIVSIPTITDYPYFIDFEEWSGGWTVSEESINSSWEFGTPDGVDITLAASGQNAWVTNLTGDYNNNELSYLLSPCMDFSSLTVDPRISFSIFMQTEDCCDEAWLEASTDGGMTWSKIGAAGTGVNWYNDSFNEWWDGSGGFEGWSPAINELTGFAGQEEVRIRFVFSSDFSVAREGMGIDNVFISEPLTNDLTAIRTSNTTELECGEEFDQVVLEIGNFGTATQDVYSVSYTVNGGPVVTETVEISIEPEGDPVLYTFTAPFDSSEPGDYEITAWVSLNNEQFRLNDTTSFVFSTTTNLPFVENFESGNLPEGWTTDDGFVTNDHGNVSFVIADNLWTADQSFEVITPVVGPLAIGDSLTFDYRYVDFTGGGEIATVLGAGDSLEVQISTDCGESYQTLLTINSDNHVASPIMTRRTLFLDDFAEQTVKFRFGATWGEGDYWLDLDNINLVRCPASLGLDVSVIGESNTNAADGAATVSAEEGLEPFSYEWSTGDSTKTVTRLSGGAYAVTVTDLAGCSEIIEFEVPTLVSVREIDNIVDINLFPNPTSNRSLLHVDFAERVDARIQLVDMMGRSIYELVSRDTRRIEEELDLSAYPNGLYLVRLIVDNKVHTRKLIRSGGF